jgi:lambda repressor-like predicted transcriptional regulator
MQKATEWKPQALRKQLRARGISVRRLAAEAGEYPSNLYDVLAGVPVGPVRRARIAKAAQRLGLLGDADSGEDW